MKHRIREKGFSALEAVILIVVVAALALGGWYVWQKNKDGDPKKITQGQQTEEQNTEAPAGWKFYKNEEIGFSFYYPPEWGDVQADNGYYLFSSLPGASFQANRRDKQHDPVELGIKDDNIINVSVRDDSAVINYLTGVDPPKKEKIVTGDSLVKKLADSLACVTDDVYSYEFYSDPDAINTHVYLGYCGLLNPIYGAFTFNSNGRDITEPESSQLKEDILKLLQTFETF